VRTFDKILFYLTVKVKTVLIKGFIPDCQQAMKKIILQMMTYHCRADLCLLNAMVFKHRGKFNLTFTSGGIFDQEYR